MVNRKSPTDEWCWSFCSQNAMGRAGKREPSCRSFCIRRVFAHEVMKAVTQDSSEGTRTTLEYIKHPLPPEGQRADQVPGGKSENDRYERKLRERDVKYWEEGWYFWGSKGKWGIYEKLELMGLDLSKQTNWYKHMEKQRRDWDRNISSQSDMGHSESAPPGVIAPHWPYPSKQSILVRLPPNLSPYFDRIREPIYKTTTTTIKVATKLYETFESGDQKRLSLLVWQKAMSGEPLMLARNTCNKMLRWWRNEPEDNPWS